MPAQPGAPLCFSLRPAFALPPLRLDVAPLDRPGMPWEGSAPPSLPTAPPIRSLGERVAAGPCSPRRRRYAEALRPREGRKDGGTKRQRRQEPISPTRDAWWSLWQVDGLEGREAQAGERRDRRDDTGGAGGIAVRVGREDAPLHPPILAFAPSPSQGPACLPLPRPSPILHRNKTRRDPFATRHGRSTPCPFRTATPT